MLAPMHASDPEAATVLAQSAPESTEIGDAATLPPVDHTEQVPAPAGPVDTSALRRGSSLGRYVVLDVLGRGGMGIVYAAYDPELDRKIAVKLVKWGSSSTAGTGGRSRLQREAQALAKLTHSNIVGVYDVGTIGDAIFVAMEFISGETIAAWIKRRWPADPPHWRDVLSIMVPAGRGLAAAHAAEIIHRDFKPENVMMDPAGRIVVLDFGLARPTSTSRSRSHDDPKPIEISAATSLMMPLTLTGSVMGTPAYMSPEQFAGQDTDAATDQFSFCVSLYHALYGERPFPGDNINELTTSVFKEQVRPAPKGTSVPAWLRRVVLRGLSRRPAERWSSMEELLAALENDPARRRKRIAFGVAAVAVLGGAIWGSRALATRDDPCAHLEGVA